MTNQIARYIMDSKAEPRADGFLQKILQLEAEGWLVSGMELCLHKGTEKSGDHEFHRVELYDKPQSIYGFLEMFADEML